MECVKDMFRIEYMHWINGSGFYCTETVDNLNSDEYCTAEEYVDSAIDAQDLLNIQDDALKILIVRNDNNEVVSTTWIYRARYDMLLKIYSKGCVRPAGKYSVNATMDDLNEAINRNIYEASMNGYIDLFNEDGDIEPYKYNYYRNKAINFFWRNKYINAGDFVIRYYDEPNDIIDDLPNMCGYDADVIFR